MDVFLRQAEDRFTGGKQSEGQKLGAVDLVWLPQETGSAESKGESHRPGEEGPFLGKAKVMRFLTQTCEANVEKSRTRSPDDTATAL